MRLLHLTWLCYVLNILSSDPAPECAPPTATNILYQSRDGGLTWHDISASLPETEDPLDFFAGDSELYLRAKHTMYRSKSNLRTPVWEKESVLDQRIASIAFNHSRVIAYNYEGLIYQKVSAETWLPRFTNFDKYAMRTIFETSDGTLFLGTDNGLFKSKDSGQNWRKVQDEGWVMNMVEAEGILVATGQKGIMRSTDNGEHWHWVIREGGVGIAIERIDGGFAAISCNTRTMSRRIHISLDNGKTWTAVSDGLPPTLFITSVKQVGKYLLCAHPDGIFRSSDLGKNWNMVHPGVDQNNFKFKTISNSASDRQPSKVFKLHVSGDVVYALAGNAGC